MTATRTVVRTVCIALLGLTPACARRPRIAPVAPDSVVLAFGNSLTSGEGASSHASYPARLRRMLGCRVINAGVPGETADQGRKRLPRLLNEHRPDLVLVCHGGNDLLQRRPHEDIAADLRTIVRRIRESGADVVLIGVPQPGLRLVPPRFYRDLSREFGIPYQRGILREILTTPGLTSDPVHPNAEGYDRLARAMADLIRRSEDERMSR